MDYIGLFQLENLILARSPFTFFDLREKDGETPPPEPILSYLKTATRLKADEVLSHVKSADKARPILLVGQTEKESAAVARDLEAAGFSNVYIVAGGVTGLVSEL